MQNFSVEHEAVCYCHDRETGLQAIIAIHSTKLGPALGGTRIFPYRNETEARHDVLELSRAMTFKAAAADLPFGGAKAVIIADPDSMDKQRALKAYAHFINLFEGNFQTGEDLGTTQEDILYLRKFTERAHATPLGLPDWMETSALTARGVLCGIEASLQHKFGSPEVRGRSVAVQGLGKVGMNLSRYLAGKGAKLIVSDVRPGLADRASMELGCTVADPDSILDVDADIFSPCAVGRVLTPESVTRLKARIVAGCANNQLSDDFVADWLRNQGILYAPDYVINAGGLISALFEMKLESQESMVARVDAIGKRLLQIYADADKENVSTLQIVRRYVEQKLS